jgi:hypothetical protein
MFDDIPVDPKLVAAQAPKPGMFDDLIPTNQAQLVGKPATTPSGPAPDTMTDVAHSLLTGAGRGAISLLGAPADLTSLAARGVDALAGTNLAVKVAPFQREFGAGRLQSEMEKKTGKFYEPQTTAGKYAQTIGEFAPAAIGGPETLFPRLMTRVVAPAVGSETAGELTEGTPYEGVARLGGALVGGLTGVKGADVLSTAALRRANPVPTEQELQAAARGPGQGYSSPDIANLQLNQSAGLYLGNQIRSALRNAKVDPINGAQYYDLADRLETPRFGPNLTIDDLDSVRQDAAYNPVSATPADKRAGPAVRNVIDNYLDGGIPQSHILAGDADSANQALVDARSNYAAFKRSEEITDAIGRAQNQAASAGSGFNIGNAIRQQLRPILNEKQGIAKRPGFENYDANEQDALANVGSTTANVLRYAGNTLGGGGGLGHGLSAFGGTMTAHEAGYSWPESLLFGALSAGAGRGFTSVANRMTLANAQRMAELLRTRSALAQARGIPVGGFQNTGILGQLTPRDLAFAPTALAASGLTVPRITIPLSPQNVQ